MRAGSLRHKVTIEAGSTERDAFGGTVASWSTFATAYASIEQMKAYDKQAAQASWPGADITITMRYMPGILPNMRIVHGDMIYSILGQPNNLDGRNRELILTCQSGVSGS